MGKNKSNNKKKGKGKSKINISLFLSIVAIIISIGQFIFDNPYFLKHFNKVEIVVTELGITKAINSDRIEADFLIENVGNNTAKNVEIQLRVLKNSQVIFMPNTFSLENPNEPETPVKNLVYKCKAIVPGEKVKVYVLSNFEDFLKINKIDTLLYNTRTLRPRYDYGPYITSAKHDSGKAKYSSLVYYYLKEK
ncbi:hypothetical protein [Xanthomarina sp. GH4-25]|uniref:hypothetical protein n=1 Tax=Xanthomarina sp. GH4-25 TaxID=3349335 RepID=UPI003878028E